MHGNIQVAGAEGMSQQSEMSGASCGTWTQERVEGGPQAAVDAEWIFGFVSGVNWGRASLTNRNSLLGYGIDENGWVAFVDQYCLGHPLDTVGAAAIHLIQELERRARQEVPLLSVDPHARSSI